MTDLRAVREALWVACMAAIGLLVLLLLHLSGKIMVQVEAAGQAPITPGFWFVVALTLGLSALIPWLLRDSQPVGFRVLAVLFTALAPALLVLFLVVNLWVVTGG
jgi:hypothetical protein